MSQVVQARCPHCMQTLRIPSEWIGKAMRCKFCKSTFQARTRTSDTPLPANTVAAPVARAAPVSARPVVAETAITASPAGWSLPSEPAGAATPRRRSGGSGKVLLLAGCAVALLILVVPVGLGMFLALGGAALLWELPETGPDSRDEAVVVADKVAADGAKKEFVVTRDATGKKNLDKKGGPLKKDKVAAVPPKGEKDWPPRRALLINVCNYLYLNSVDKGKERNSIAGLKEFVLPNTPFKTLRSQIFLLSDDGLEPHPTELSVLKNAIKDFLDSSRAQDRVYLLFAGHATEIEKDAYLIPINGRKEDPDTLLPLAWVYEQLAACKARQKVLILDVFRFPPARGFELPGAGASEEGEMGEVFDAALQKPPPGVQVWSSCIKGQRSIEFEGGSVFLQALGQAKGPSLGSAVNPNDPLPFDAKFVETVNQRMKELIGGEKYVQTSRMTGSPPSSGAPFDPAEPRPPALVLKPPAVPGGQVASAAQINGILDEIRQLPAVRQGKAGSDDRLLKAVNLPVFPAKALTTYQPDDYKSVADLLERHRKDPKAFGKQHPLRAAYFDAVDALKKSSSIHMLETINGPIDPKQKAFFLKQQSEPGIMIFELEQVLGQMRTVAEDDMDKETSKRWRANFEFAQARVKARLVYIYEYSFLLGQVRLDALPALEKGEDGWRMGSRKKIQVTEPKAKTYAKEVANAWRDLQKNFPDTPWSVLAYRESLVALGLEWRTKKE